MATRAGAGRGRGVFRRRAARLPGCGRRQVRLPENLPQLLVDISRTANGSARAWQYLALELVAQSAAALVRCECLPTRALRRSCSPVSSPGRRSFPAAWAARLRRTRWVVRAPVLLFRARLGFLFGSRLLMLEHVGRKTGIQRYAVLETVDRTDPGTYVVAAGFGDRSQWLRNITADPRVRASVGRRFAVPATAP